jgi:hypothetical protein
LLTAVGADREQAQGGLDQDQEVREGGREGGREGREELIEEGEGGKMGKV